MKTNFILKILVIMSLLTSCSTDSSRDKIKQSGTKITEEKDSLHHSKNEGQLTIEPIDTKLIKNNFEFKGNIKQSIKWQDSEGTHIVFTSETGVYHTDETEDGIFMQNAEIFCFHYLEKKNNYTKIWRIYDYSKDCDADAMATFVQNSLKITDLNKNGIAEIWTMYGIACRSDVSPSELKLIMYEGNKKYKIVGTSKIELPGIEPYGGEMKTILNFSNEEDKFFQFAKKMWEENVNERLGGG